MKSLKFLLSTVIIIAIAIFIASPYYTAYQLKNAYDAHDGDTLVSYIDFQQLQPNLQSQLTDRFADTLSQYPLVSRFGGEALTGAVALIIDESVQRAVTAENISSLIATQGQASQATKELAAIWAITTNRVNLKQFIQEVIRLKGNFAVALQNQIQTVITTQSSELATHVQTGEDSDKPELSYCGINCFAISGNIKGYPITVEMQRNGFSNWKIIDITLP